MRILHINCNYIGTALHQLMIEKLDALGVENEVFVPTYDRNVAVIKPNANVYVSECFNKCDRLLFDYKQVKIIKAIEEHYDVKSFDLIHAYTLFTDGNAARELSEKYGIPYVVAVRNTDVNVFLKKIFFLRNRGIKTLLHADKVFFLSESYHKQVVGKYIPRKQTDRLNAKVDIIPNGIDDFWFANKPILKKDIDKSCINLIYAGGIDKNKNILSTQKAMGILRARGIQTHLTVVGKINDKAEYERIIRDNNTTYIPVQPKEKLIEIYRKNDIFVMPSIHESFGLVYAEALSQGLPVVYTRGQGFDGQFKEGEVGYSVDCCSLKSIADAIEKIVFTYFEFNVIGRAKKFMWESLAKKYLHEYEILIDEEDNESNNCIPR